jgi:hypothetical protein
VTSQRITKDYTFATLRLMWHVCPARANDVQAHDVSTPLRRWQRTAYAARSMDILRALHTAYCRNQAL